jgi:hypothetical protein
VVGCVGVYPVSIKRLEFVSVDRELDLTHNEIKNGT